MERPSPETAGSGSQSAAPVNRWRDIRTGIIVQAIRGAQVAVFAFAFTLAGGIVGAILLHPVWLLVNWIWNWY